jgi:hypothetical protein
MKMFLLREQLSRVIPFLMMMIVNEDVLITYEEEISVKEIKALKCLFDVVRSVALRAL